MGTVETEGDEEFSKLINSKNGARKSLGRTEQADKLRTQLAGQMNEKNNRKSLSKTLKNKNDNSHGRNNNSESKPRGKSVSFITDKKQNDRSRVNSISELGIQLNNALGPGPTIPKLNKSPDKKNGMYFPGGHSSML